jgi:hypothetical protein
MLAIVRTPVCLTKQAAWALRHRQTRSTAGTTTLVRLLHDHIPRLPARTRPLKAGSLLYHLVDTSHQSTRATTTTSTNHLWCHRWTTTTEDHHLLSQYGRTPSSVRLTARVHKLASRTNSHLLTHTTTCPTTTTLTTTKWTTSARLSSQAHYVQGQQRPRCHRRVFHNIPAQAPHLHRGQDCLLRCSRPSSGGRRHSLFRTEA